MLSPSAYDTLTDLAPDSPRNRWCLDLWRANPASNDFARTHNCDTSLIFSYLYSHFHPHGSFFLLGIKRIFTCSAELDDDNGVLTFCWIALNTSTSPNVIFYLRCCGLSWYFHRCTRGCAGQHPRCHVTAGDYTDLVLAASKCHS